MLNRGNRWLFAPVLAIFLAFSPGFADDEPFPATGPATRAVAVSALTQGSVLPIPSLTPFMLSTERSTSPPPAPIQRAQRLLQGPLILPSEQVHLEPDGNRFRYTESRSAFDRIDPLDADQDGLPDQIEAAAGGLRDAHALLVGELGLGDPGPRDVLLARVGGGLDGAMIPDGATGRPRLILDATVGSEPTRVRKAAIHEYAHAVAYSTGRGVPVAWAEAFASWAQNRLGGGYDDAFIGRINRRLAALHRGLQVDDLDLAAGNSIWFSFLEQNYGVAAVQLVVEELAAGGQDHAALERGLQRAGVSSLSEAFREFHLWSLLVGDHADGRHFNFADLLESPRFAADVEGLPAMALREGTPLGSLGATQIRLRTDDPSSGMRIQFDGDLSGRWTADLLLFLERGGAQRLPLDLSDEGRGEVIVPLSRVREAVLLVRNEAVSGEGKPLYSWTADAERGYPVELDSVDVLWNGAGAGALVMWETRSEQQLLGFNVMRRADGQDRAMKLNPVWIPALGDPSVPMSYQFLDTGADPERSYTYTIEAVTEDGLSSLSSPAPLSSPSR